MTSAGVARRVGSGRRTGGEAVPLSVPTRRRARAALKLTAYTVALGVLGAGIVLVLLSAAVTVTAGS